MKPIRDNRRLSSLPTAGGGIARAAYARALEAGLEVEPLLKSCHLTSEQAKNSRLRIPVKDQVNFLNQVADKLSDPFLGIHLAEGIDLREMGLLYYVLASSDRLGDALQRLARYSGINNEGIRITCHERKEIAVQFEYEGVARVSDRHQIEFFVTTLIRICRQLSGRNVPPRGVRLAHRRTNVPPRIMKVFGCEVAFGSSIDEVTFSPVIKSIPVVNADAYLNSLLVRYCEEALSNRHERLGPWRARVENAIVPLLPHGQAKIREVAQRLGVGKRTLARLLASEGVTFRGILDALRYDLAKRYLREENLPISEVAWLLGLQEVSAFSHACKRWTGKTPKQVRSTEIDIVAEDPGAASGPNANLA
jgi:AraC-like DNA-binding protein